MKILAITQARIGSSRFPEKILKKINGETLLEIHLKRILNSKSITKLKVATTTELNNGSILKICQKLSVQSYQGSLNNVLERFYMTALPEMPDYVVRLTSDCPLIDPEEMDKVIRYAVEKNLDYVSNTLKPTYPDGLDTEVFKFSALKMAYDSAILKSEMEHVTPYIWKNSSFMGGKLFTSDCIMNTIDYSNIRMTVDTIDDFKVVEYLISSLGTERPWMDYVNLLLSNPGIKSLNEHYKRNEGYQKSIDKEKNK